MNRILFTLFFLLNILLVQAQIERLPADFRQHNLTSYNASLFNPAFSLSRNNAESVALWGRWQWQGIDADPTSFFLNYTRPLNNRSAAAVGFFQHNTGIFFETGAALNYAYRFQFNEQIKLSVGANLFGFRQTLADDRFQVNPDLPLPINTDTKDFVLQFAPGVNLEVQRFSLSLASENLLDYNFGTKEGNTAGEDKTFMSLVSYDLPLSFGNVPNTFLRPAIYYRTVPGQSNQFGLYTYLNTNDYWGQVGYNNFYGYALGGGYTFFDRLAVGALVELGTGSSLSNETSFELMASYFLGTSSQRQKMVGEDLDSWENNALDTIEEIEEKEDAETEKKASEDEKAKAAERELEKERKASEREERKAKKAEEKQEREAAKQLEKLQKAKQDSLAQIEKESADALKEQEKMKEKTAEDKAKAEEARKKEQEKVAAEKAKAEEVRKQELEKEAAEKAVEEEVRREAQEKSDEKKTEAEPTVAEPAERTKKADLKKSDDAESRRIAEERRKDSLDRAKAAEAKAIKVEQQRKIDSVAEARAAAIRAEREAKAKANEKETVVPEKGEKYIEVETEGELLPGYYLIANVFATQKYYRAFITELRKKGLNPGSFTRGKDSYRYVYLQRYDTIEAARAARDSKYEGNYDEFTWIFRVRGR